MPTPPQPTAQPPGLHHKRIGTLTVTAISDGMFQGDFAMLANLPSAEAEALHKARFRAIPPRLAINCFLIQAGDRLTLVDTGCGVAFGPELGRLVAVLGTLGIEPNDIGTVLATHLHPDHIGGLVDGAGAAIFPNAELVVHQKDHAFWGDDATLAGATTDQDRGFVTLAQTAIAAYANRTRLLTTGDALPSITILPEPGHTPGHSGYLIASGNDSLLIWGDIVHMPGIQFPRPDVGMGFDIDGAAAIETRKRIMDMTATDRLMVAGMHLDFPCFGHVVRETNGYAFIPDVWTPSV